MNQSNLCIINTCWTENSQKTDQEFLKHESEHVFQVEQSLKQLGFELYHQDDENMSVSHWEIESHQKRFRRYTYIPSDFKISGIMESNEWLLNQQKMGRMYVANVMHLDLDYSYIPNVAEKAHIENVESAFKSLGLKCYVSNRDVVTNTLSPKYWSVDFINKIFHKTHTNDNSLYLPTEESTVFLHRLRGKIHGRDFGI